VSSGVFTENFFSFCMLFYRLAEKTATLKKLTWKRQEGTKKPAAAGFKDRRVKTKVEVERSSTVPFDFQPDKNWLAIEPRTRR